MSWIFSLLEQPLIWLSHLASRPSGHTPEQSEHAPGLGIEVSTRAPFSLSAADLARHAYILGSTGCGKTTLILKLLERDILASHSVVVIDLRGDLVNGVLAVCEKLSVEPSRVTLLDLRDRDGTVGFNPLSGAGEPYIRALHVLDVVAKEAESWGVQLEETLRSALLLLAAASAPLTELENLFYNRSFRLECLSHSDDASLSGFWQRFDALNPQQQQAWSLPVLNKVTSLLAVPTLRQILSGSPCLDLGELLDRKGDILLVSLAVDELHRSSRMLGSLLVSALSREMMARVNVPESRRNPVRLYVDEFENMASESFEGLIAEGRRFGLALVLSHQTLSQLPARLRSVIRNNVGVQMIFQCGFEDAASILKELPAETELDDIRALEPGEAFVLMRDGSAERVRFHPPGKPAASRAVNRYRQSLLTSNERGDGEKTLEANQTAESAPEDSVPALPEDLL